MVSTRSTTATATKSSASDVLVYVPNLIGYGRVAATIASIMIMVLVVPRNSNDGGGYSTIPSSAFLAVLLYVSSFVGDLFDGLVARKLGQTSTFGGLLDMVTDRCSTLGLLFVLVIDYDDRPLLRLTFIGLALLDISSHWCQMYSTAALGQHHKSEDGNEGRHFLVRWFYKYYFFFGYLCVGAEFTYLILYTIQFTGNMEWVHSCLMILLYVAVPACVLKQLVNVSQLSSACYAVAQYDAATKTR